MPRVAEVSVQTVLVPDMKRAADDWPAFAAKASLPTFPNQAVDNSFALYGGIAQQRAALSLPALVEGGRPGVTGGSMAEPTNSAVTDDNALPRCCPVHHDWPTLSQHLLVDFPEIGINDIIREIRNAKSAVESMALDDSDEIEIGEVLVRQQLMLRAGRRSDGARLDPEAHRGASAVCRVGATVGVSPTVDG